MAKRQRVTAKRTKQGDELTPKFIELLSQEAEAGFDDWDGKVVRAGRPGLSPEGPSRRLQTRIAPEIGDQLDALAGKRDTTVSEIVREALERYLADVA